MGNGYDGDGQWMNGHMGTGAWLGMGLLMFVGVALLIGLVVWLVRMSPSAGAPAPRPTAQTPTASTILDERFARGEIEAEEYQQRREALGGTRS